MTERFDAALCGEVRAFVYECGPGVPDPLDPDSRADRRTADHHRLRFVAARR